MSQNKKKKVDRHDTSVSGMNIFTGTGRGLGVGGGGDLDSLFPLLFHVNPASCTSLRFIAFPYPVFCVQTRDVR